MPILNNPGNVLFEGPATYRIVVQGELSEMSRRRFAGMTVENDPAATDRPRTILRGQGFNSPPNPPPIVGFRALSAMSQFNVGLVHDKRPLH